MKLKAKPRHLKDEMNMLYDEIKPVKEFIKGKSVAIVGNAKSLFDHKFGAEIDGHDVVIRFNRGFITQTERQGSKTDIVLLACELSLDEKASYKAKFYVNRSKKTKTGELTICDGRRRVFRVVLESQPSSGFLAVDLCMTAGASKIDLYGFDFEKTPTFYNPAGYQTKHDYAKEKEIMLDLQKRGVLTIHEND